MSILSALPAAGLAGVGCLSCLPLLGAVIASSSIASILDEHLLLLQVSLLGLSAIASGVHFYRNGKSGKKTAMGAVAYGLLLMNATYFQNRIFAFVSLVGLIAVHLWKEKLIASAEDIRLLYFKGCPNHPILKSILLNSEITNFREIDLETLTEADPLRSFSSPTLLIGERTVIGTKTTGGSLSCSFMSREEMQAIVREAFSRKILRRAATPI